MLLRGSSATHLYCKFLCPKRGEGLSNNLSNCIISLITSDMINLICLKVKWLHNKMKNNNTELSKKDKAMIEVALDRAVVDYGELFKKLAKE